MRIWTKLVSLAHGLSDNTEAKELMTAAGHEGIIQMFWPHFWGTRIATILIHAQCFLHAGFWKSVMVRCAGFTSMMWKLIFNNFFCPCIFQFLILNVGKCVSAHLILVINLGLFYAFILTAAWENWQRKRKGEMRNNIPGSGGCPQWMNESFLWRTIMLSCPGLHSIRTHISIWPCINRNNAV